MKIRTQSVSGGRDLEQFGRQGLQEKIELVPLDTTDKPAWYKRVYPWSVVWLKFKYTQFPVNIEILAILRPVISLDRSILRAQQQCHMREFGFDQVHGQPLFYFFRCRSPDTRFPLKTWGGATAGDRTPAMTQRANALLPLAIVLSALDSHFEGPKLTSDVSLS
jgi:hypothetical protein